MPDRDPGDLCKQGAERDGNIGRQKDRERERVPDLAACRCRDVFPLRDERQQPREIQAEIRPDHTGQQIIHKRHCILL